MQASDIPSKFEIPFAESAGGSFRRVVPIASQVGLQDGAASFTTGFPPLNFDPVASGGVPPFGQDVNGVLFMMSGWDRWFFSGGPIAYDGAYSAEIGGYPEGAIVASATVAGRLYLCLADDNTTDPDAAGANWKAYSVRVSPNGQSYFQFTSASTATLVPRGGACLVIAGVPYEIASAGIVVNLLNCVINGTSGQVAAINTAYNAFVFNNSGTLTIDLRHGTGSGHVMDTTAGNVGVEVRNNSGTPDSTRSFIGSFATNALGQIAATGSAAISSWFNQSPSVRTRLTAETTYYVATTGADTNDGSSSAPWLTLQHAYEWIRDNLDLAGQKVIVQVANGTYAVGVEATGPIVGMPIHLKMEFRGNLADNGLCIIATAGGRCFAASYGAMFDFRGFTLETSNASAVISIDYGSFIGVGSNIFGAVTGGHFHMAAVRGGTIMLLGENYTITGGANAHFGATEGPGLFTNQGGCHVTGVGTLTFTQAFCVSQIQSSVDLPAMTFGVTAIGKKYDVNINSTLNTRSGDQNYFPGNQAGVSSNNGIYI